MQPETDRAGEPQRVQGGWGREGERRYPRPRYVGRSGPSGQDWVGGGKVGRWVGRQASTSLVRGVVFGVGDAVVRSRLVGSTGMEGRLPEGGEEVS